MTRLIIVIIFIYFNQFCIAQDVDSFAISNTEIKTFLNDARQILNLPIKFNLSDKISEAPSALLLERVFQKDTILTEDDKSHLKMQLNQRRILKWSDSLIDKVAIIESENIDSIFKTYGLEIGWRNFRQTYHGNFYDLSLPFFTKGMHTCIIYIGYHCGSLCGEGRIFILRLQQNGWTLYKSARLWVS